MSKFSNIYDIDGKLIRGADQGPFTLEETEKLVDELTQKVKDNPDNEVYKVYLNNAQKWLFKLYNEMSREDLMKRMSFVTNQLDKAKSETTEAEQQQLDDITKAMNDLKEAYEKEDKEGNGGELVEEVECPMDNSDTPEPVVMDEYVEPIEEVKD